MSEELVQQMMAAAEKLASATEALDRVLGKLDAQQEILNANVDRIVAAVEENIAAAEKGTDLRVRMAELEQSNADLKAQAARLARKTLSPVVSALLAKNEIEGERFDASVLDKTLAGLSVEQRMAVKAEMARAGMIE